MRRANATGDDHRVCTPHRRRQRIHQSFVVVAHHHLVMRIEAFLSQTPPDDRRIAVHDLAKQEFGSYGYNLDDHVATTSAARSTP